MPLRPVCRVLKTKVESKVTDEEKMLAEEFNLEFPKEMEQLRKYTKAAMAITTARKALSFMKALEPSVGAEEFHWEYEAHTTTFCMAYGRLFNSGQSSNFNGTRVPTEFEPVHEELLKLRNLRYAHNFDNSQTLGALDIQVSKDGSQVNVAPLIRLEYVTNPKFFEIAPKILDWLETELRGRMARTTSRLNDLSHREWSFELHFDV